MNPSAHRVVIVGGGFAGLHTAKHLGKTGYQVTLLDKRNFQLFQPLLYQVATGSLTIGDIAIPQRVVLRRARNVQCLTATAYDIDPARKVVHHEFGEIGYDTLIVATGVKHHYFGNDAWRAFAPGLKTAEHAIEMRRKIFGAFERAEITEDPAEQADLLTFVIVGAGPTGVELAGAIGELAHKTMVRDFRRIDPQRARVLLVEGAADVLPLYDAKLRRAARRQLEALGVTVMTETLVEDVSADGVRVRQGEHRETIRARTVLWAAGVRASLFGQILADRTGVALDRGGRVRVEPDCSLPGHPEIFVLGDLARMTDARGREVPGLAPAAIQQGRYVATILKRRAAGKALPGAFRYADWGTMAVIGMNRAVGDLRAFRTTGVIAWYIWALVHIRALIDGSQRLRVFVQWSWKYFTRHIGDRLVTGNPTSTQALREAHGSDRVKDAA
ncbi:NAD(P)/FAD-dependent oxidoreductase [Flagellatimonas centrodinii]|uniref:NAD(P)/FAD-dependent oxidoreductase n=1 Tax=Flagellatimonas centrodinii TaxID=2806210 RepID=UPI001FF010DE|nr:NAD(P)/FAD-dependent oxidoreductase [Flagellatimonas centrodinii]ULQ48092.1 NAD(P)/FAD-dependent oxidoreductase [Flagellatimonas centrodinii]